MLLVIGYWLKITNNKQPFDRAQASAVSSAERASQTTNNKQRYSVKSQLELSTFSVWKSVQS
ncbi:MAG TPA: hypothetical protein DCE56_45465 [Cyanobacteria bacterium UBA8553]|nr:hypothetical protein [Cyanobacteria bacterium UBA8553]